MPTQDSFHWTCPYCNRDSIITKSNYSSKAHIFNQGNRLGSLGILSNVIVCPNPKCREFTITSHLYYVRNEGYGDFVDESKPPIDTFILKPKSQSKVFPDYIPIQIRNDYEEACLVLSLSPKAAATLARRCLQGMIRDFWKVSRARLIDEINDIKDKIDPDVWQAIDAVRKIGNVGAHMEKDVNQIIEVDINEAQLLISLIEMLMKEWYISANERRVNLAAIDSAANNKDKKKE